MEYCEACAMGMIERITIGDKVKTICKYRDSTGKNCPYGKPLRLSYAGEIRDLCLDNGKVVEAGKIEYEKRNVVIFPLERVQPSKIENDLTLILPLKVVKQEEPNLPEGPDAA